MKNVKFLDDSLHFCTNSLSTDLGDPESAHVSSTHFQTYARVAVVQVRSMLGNRLGNTNATQRTVHAAYNSVARRCHATPEFGCRRMTAAESRRRHIPYQIVRRARYQPCSLSRRACPQSSGRVPPNPLRTHVWAAFVQVREPTEGGVEGFGARRRPCKREQSRTPMLCALSRSLFAFKAAPVNGR
jgi:hypothetical protein